MAIERREISIKNVLGFVGNIPQQYLGWVASTYEIKDERIEFKQLAQQMHMEAVKDILQASSNNEMQERSARLRHELESTFIKNFVEERPQTIQVGILNMLIKEGENAQKQFQETNNENHRQTFEACNRLVLKIRNNLNKSTLD
ncbi:MAG: hypothetical protein Q7R97_05065 [Candidatus Daviesbacteria bacterium]|nr:hypothetical protein [Candidatus Daviesbacteria bacterium]